MHVKLSRFQNKDKSLRFHQNMFAKGDMYPYMRPRPCKYNESFFTVYKKDGEEGLSAKGNGFQFPGKLVQPLLDFLGLTGGNISVAGFVMAHQAGGYTHPLGKAGYVQK